MKPLRCRMGFHAGNIETASVDWEQADLAITFMPCSRCGDLVPLDLKPRHQLEARLLDEPLEEYR